MLNRKRLIVLLSTLTVILMSFIVIFSMIANKSYSLEHNMNGITEDDLLVGSKIKVSSIAITSKSTGTPYFDNNDNPGNDSSATNNIVRSFDDITWILEPTFSRIDVNDNSVVQGGVIQIKASVPEIKVEGSPMVYKWDVTDMLWADSYKISSNGCEIVVNYRINKDQVIDSLKQEIPLKLKVLGSPNGLEILPTFSFNMAGNSSDDIAILHDEKIIVSAKPSINFSIGRNGNLNSKDFYDLANNVVRSSKNDTSIFGRISGYGVMVELRNVSFIDSSGVSRAGSSKKLKGIELPKGPIEFDIVFNEVKNSVEVTNEEYYHPTFWAYRENSDSGLTGKYYNINNNTVYTRPVNFNATILSRFHSGFPGSRGNNSRNAYNSGNWDIKEDTENRNILHVKISGYQFHSDFKYPTQNTRSDDKPYGQDNGRLPFSVQYLQEIMQFPEDATGTITLKSEITNLKYQTLSSDEIITQDVVTTDNKTSTDIKIATGSGSYARRVLYQSSNTSGTYSGDAHVYISHQATIGTVFKVEATNESDNWIYGLDIFVKIDDKGIELVESDKEYTSNTGTYNIIYAARKNDCTKGWSSYSEMQSAKMKSDTLKYYDTLAELKADGCVCVGYIAESTKITLTANTSAQVSVPYRVLETAKIGEVYPILYDVRAYDQWHIPNRTTQSHLYTTNASDFPSAVYNYETVAYSKTKYNINGNIIANHTPAAIAGNSLLIIGATQKIPIRAINDENKVKSTYHLSKNENIAKFEFSPSITNDKTDASSDGIKLKYVVTLPKGLSYIPLTSSYEEPIVVRNANGTSTLTWYMENQTVNKPIEPITFNTLIDEMTKNNTTYQVSSIISEEPVDGKTIMGNYAPGFRTYSTTITVTNLGGYSMNKITSKPIIDVDNESNFTVTAFNNSDLALDEFQLLDILPYNGDGRGTDFTGTYNVENINLRVVDSNNLDVSNNIKIYISNHEDVKLMDVKNIDFSKFTELEEEIGEITGIALKGVLPAMSKVILDMNIKTSNNSPGDKYVNSSSVQTSQSTEPLTTSNAHIEVINRLIDGVVWLDSNYNGLIDEDEELINNYDIELLDSNNTLVRKTKTNSEGYYIFNNLPRGIYKVRISHEGYLLTEANVGTNTEINSKFENDEKDIDSLDSSNMPLIKESDVNLGLVMKSKITIKHLMENSEEYITLRNGEKATKEEREDIVGKEYTTSVADHAEYLELVSEPDNKDGTYQEKEQEVIYYYRFKKYPYKVQYYDIDTKEEIHEEKEVTDKEYGSKILSVDEIIEIDNYKYEESDKESIIIDIDLDNNIIKLYYSRVSKVIVKYIDIDTEEEIADKETLTGKINTEYKTEKKDIDSYEYVKSTDNTEGEYKEEDQLVIYYYKKIKQVQVPITVDRIYVYVGLLSLSLILIIFLLKLLKKDNKKKKSIIIDKEII